MITTSDVELAHAIARDCYGPRVSAEPVAASNHVVLRLLLPDGERILKVAAPDAGPESIRREVGLLRFLEAAGIPVPELETESLDGGARGRPFFVTKSAGDTTVMDWANEPGQLPRHLFTEMGTLLASIHAVTPDEEARQALGLAGSDPTDLLAEVFAFCDQLVEEGVLEEGDVALHKSLALPPIAGRALCHADFHAPQCIVNRGRIVAVVDWESAWVGNPAVDVAFTHTYLDYYCLLRGENGAARGMELRACFFEGYQRVGTLPADYELAYLPVRMTHLVGAMRAWHGWGAEVWRQAREARIPRAAALYRAYGHKLRSRGVA